MDQVKDYVVWSPSASNTWFGTVSSGTAGTFVLDNIKADYPRNVLFTLLSGTVGATASVYGKDQFGNTISDTMGFTSAVGGGTAAGTKVFSQVGSATMTHSGGTAIGTAKLGVAIGTAAGVVGFFGLPDKIRAVTDVKSINWITTATATPLNGGTIGTALVGVANSTFQGTAVIATTDRFVVRYKSSYVAEENVINANY